MAQQKYVDPAGPLRHRLGGGEPAVMRKLGGSDETEAAVDRVLA